MRRVRQEIHCHACGNYVQFRLDMELNGNHVLNCPKCGHEHCRVVKDGRITDIRWDQRNGPTWQAHTYGWTTTSTATTFSDTTAYVATTWYAVTST